MTLVAELPLREQFDGIDVARVNTVDPVLILYGASGTHFTDVFVYDFLGGEPELLFADGSASGAEVRYDAASGAAPMIRIGVEDWGDPNWNFAQGERRWNIYSWDGNEFAYNERLSSAREMGMEERLSLYTMGILKRADELQAGTVSRRRDKLEDGWEASLREAMSQAP